MPWIARNAASSYIEFAIPQRAEPITNTAMANR